MMGKSIYQAVFLLLKAILLKLYIYIFFYLNFLLSKYKTEYNK